jgi:hypothetical protein
MAADRKYLGNSGASSVFAQIKSALLGKVDKKNGKDVVDTSVEDLLCTESTNGTYVLVATVNNGTVTYSWEREN